MREEAILKRKALKLDRLKSPRTELERKKIIDRKPEVVTTFSRIDLGEGQGVFDIPRAVAIYIEDLYQEAAAIHTRVASKREMLQDWNKRPPPKILSTFGGTAIKQRKR